MKIQFLARQGIEENHMSQNKKKPNIVRIIIIVIIAAVLLIPFRTGHATDGGSKFHFPLIPWYGFVEYHSLAASVREHSVDSDPEAEAESANIPSYIGGHGLMFMVLPLEIVFDKYEVYPDGHKVKISGFAIEWNG